VKNKRKRNKREENKRKLSLFFLKSNTRPSSKLGKSLIKLIYRETLIVYKIEIEINFTVKDQVLVKFDRR